MIEEVLVEEIETDDKIMRQIILFIMLIIGFFSMNVDAITAEQAFVSAPESVFPLLNKNTRLDMIDYYNSGSETASKNKLSGNSRVTSIKINDLQFEMSAASSYQISILYQKNGAEIIALIETVKTPTVDSKITFYTPDWEKVDFRYFNEPELKDWLTPKGKKNIKEIESTISFLLVECVYDAMNDELILKNNIKQILSEETFETVKSSFLPQLKYRWTGKQFKLIK